MVLLGISTRTAGAAKMLTSNEGAGAVTGLPGFSKRTADAPKSTTTDSGS